MIVGVAGSYVAAFDVDHWGVWTDGVDEDDALVELGLAHQSFAAFLALHGAACAPLGTVTIVERQSPCEEGAFDFERQPATSHERDRTLTLYRWARDGGCLELDLGSSCTDVPPTETHPHYGIYRFKSELGARLILCVGYHDRVFAPLRYRIARLLEARAHHVNRRLLGRLRLGALGGREGAPDAAPLPQPS